MADDNAATAPPAGADARSPAPSPAALLAPAPARRLAGDDVDHIRALYVQTPATLIGYALGCAVITALFHDLAAPGRLGGWLAATAVLWLVRLLHYRRYRRNHRAPDATLLAWRRSWRVLVLLQGSLWGVAVWMFWGLGTPYQQLALILVVYSFCVSSVQLLATQSWIFLAFMALVLGPTIVRIASDGSQPGGIWLAVIIAVLVAATVVLARTFGSALGQAIFLKARTDELAQQLRAEKAEAETARRAAEAANRAKTQFFAAASHDLRQPLHAMGLFAEALRQRVQHDAEVAALVSSINESVDALEGLFGELLDITRIDTGGVEVHPAPVRLRELFARLRLHFEPVAFEKGLMLSFRGGEHVVQADPVLLERVLRNLVSNAIRYSDDGGVLVSCRPRGGQLLLQVWDSGIGIPAAGLPRIWEEFYQAQGNRPLEAHHRKGLGLGLAIVHRLAGLLRSPISVRSRVGHGTVFSLTLPVGQAARTPLAAGPGVASGRAPIGLTLEGRFFVVVEDELAVREGLVVLLQAWGARVVSFDTVAGVQAWLAAAAAHGGNGNDAAPDLLLVDYRLPQGTTGIDALVALRGHWPRHTLPAIVITGSTLGGHEDEAVVHDYHLLIKPVLPNKLRAMIAFKLGVRGGS